MLPASDAFISAMKKPIKQVYIKLEIYDSKMNYIKELTQKVSRDSIGSISVDGDRDIRRSFSFKLISKNNEFDWNENSLIWIDKRVKLFVGIKLPDGTVEYVPQGVFILTQPSTEHTSEGILTEVTGQDKAYLYTGNFGKFINQTTLSVNLPIRDAIRIIAQGNGETLFNFDDDITEVVPYELTYESGSSRWDALSELASLGKSKIYFDAVGYLRLKRINLSSLQNQSPVWEFKYGDPNDKLYAGNVRKMNPNNLYNDFITLGGSGQTAIVRHQLTITETDPKWADSPYTIEKIGRSIYWHNDGNPDSLITTQSEALWRNKYSLMKYLGYTEEVSFQISPMFLLEPDDIISITDNENSVYGRFLINRLDIPLNPQLMSIDCTKENHVIDDWNFM